MDISGTLRVALADRCAIERELGQGGMATVYLAPEPEALPPSLLHSPQARTLAALGPPEAGGVVYPGSLVERSYE